MVPGPTQPCHVKQRALYNAGSGRAPGLHSMTAPETAVLIAYFFVLSILGIYGWHRYFLVYQYMKHKDRAPGPAPAVREEDLPRVTIQLPIFNVMYVVDRLVDAVCRIDYPKDKLDIQVLDDSIDETC